MSYGENPYGEEWAVSPAAQLIARTTGAIADHTAQATVTVSAVQAGDVVVVVEGSNYPGGMSTALSGLGATWTRLVGHTLGVALWVGVGATSGTVTTVAPTAPTGLSTTRRLTAYVLRGVSAAATGSLGVSTSSVDADSGTLNLGPGIAIAAGYSDNSTTAITTRDPGSGWTVDLASTLVSGVRFYNTASRVATESTPVGHRATAYRDGGAATVVLAVFPTLAPVDEASATLAATLPALTSSLAGVTTNPAPPVEGSLAATLPALGAQLQTEEAPDLAATLAGALPALTAGVAAERLSATALDYANGYALTGSGMNLTVVATPDTPATLTPEPIRVRSAQLPKPTLR